MEEFSKKIVWLLTINGIIWIYLSYILAFLDKPEIAQTLSIAVVTEMVAVTLVYCCKALFENLSKHNQWPDKGRCEEDADC
jgi:uncharacterized membrane protein